MDWDNEQICHWLTAVGLGEYVQVFIDMFVKLGITGKESSALGSFAFPFGEGKKGGCHTCTCITAIKQYYRFDQSVSYLISIS
jgi:hypothetical protein